MVAKKLASATAGLLLGIALAAPAFAGSSDSTTTTAQATNGGQTVTGGLYSVFADSVQHPTAKACKPDTLYGQHDVIGDPDSCVINRFDARAGTLTAGMTGMAAGIP
ncbi:MAG TPA: hypothetical protein VFB15_07700 [Candidatus Binataceae bacterium]|jgi:hypothetical protein|nr:hypothetical protein [Candidatus Binataceae bacterium]